MPKENLVNILSAYSNLPHVKEALSATTTKKGGKDIRNGKHLYEHLLSKMSIPENEFVDKFSKDLLRTKDFTDSTTNITNFIDTNFKIN